MNLAPPTDGVIFTDVGVGTETAVQLGLVAVFDSVVPLPGGLPKNNGVCPAGDTYSGEMPVPVAASGMIRHALPDASWPTSALPFGKFA